jgi:large subunit ribosomal protein L4
MMIKVYNLKREEVGTVDVSDEVFGGEVKEALFYEIVKAQLASRRAGTKATKERSGVRGSSKKLYKQKGTGRARQGTARAPHHAGGGMAHALEPKDWSYRPPRKMRIAALKSALSLYAKEDRLIVVDKLELAEIKTKALLGVLGALKTGKKALVVDATTNENLKRSIRNAEAHQFLPPEGVNVYDLLRHDHLVVSVHAVQELQNRCLGKGE